MMFMFAVVLEDDLEGLADLVEGKRARRVESSTSIGA